MKEIQFDVSNFSIHKGQRKQLSEINTMHLIFKKLSSKLKEDKIIQSCIDQMKEFLKLFQMPITHLQITIQNVWIKANLFTQFTQFIIQDVLPKYSNDITHLTFSDCSLSIKSKQEETQLNEFIRSIMLPLKSLNVVIITQNYQDFEINRGDFLQDALQILKANDQFKSVEFLSVLQENSEEDNESLKAKKNSLMTYQSKVVDVIMQFDHLKNLQLSMLNMNFIADFYEQTYKKISQMNLEQVGLDLWSKNCSLKQQINYLKYLTKFKKTLKELTFLSDSNCKPQDSSALKEVLLEFSSLQDLQLSGIIFSSKPVFTQFLTYFGSYQNLKRLTLDFVDTFWNKPKVCSILQQSLSSNQQLESLSITFPEKVNFDKNEYTDLQSFVLSFEKSLKHLQLFMGTFTYCEECVLVFSKIMQIENLTIFNLTIGETFFYLNAEEDGVQNVRQVKSYNFRDHGFDFNSDEKRRLNWIILMQLQNLKKLEIYYESFETIITSIEETMNHFNNFQLESLKTSTYQYRSPYFEHIQKIIKMNSNSLLYLECGYELFEGIETFPKVSSINISQKIEDALIFDKLPSMVKFVQENYFIFHYYGIQINLNDVSLKFNPDNHRYLTELSSKQQLEPKEAYDYLRKKRAMIAHLVIYSQLIKPFISYQADYIHWDLSIDF